MRARSCRRGRRSGRKSHRQRRHRHPRLGSRAPRAPRSAASTSSSPTTTFPNPSCRRPPPSSIPTVRTAPIPIRTCAAPASPSNLPAPYSMPSAGPPIAFAARSRIRCSKLVAIATVADVVPLTGENRVFVKHGLDGLNLVRNPGLRALLDVSGFDNGRVPSSRQVSFQIAPRMNAAGRMDTARTVIELFLTADPARARELATQLHDQNTERRQVQDEICEKCDAIAFDEADAALVYYGRGMAPWRTRHRRQPYGRTPTPSHLRPRPQRVRRWTSPGVRPQHRRVSSARSARIHARPVREIRRPQTRRRRNPRRRSRRRIPHPLQRLRAHEFSSPRIFEPVIEFDANLSTFPNIDERRISPKFSPSPLSATATQRPRSPPKTSNSPVHPRR